MYRYLDRAVVQLQEPEAFLLSAMRLWVGAARAGRCSCRALQGGFVRRGIAEALPDFNMLMVTLDRDAHTKLRFAVPGCSMTSEDEARLLALFAAAQEGPIARLKRVAAGLVAEDAVPRLAQAADFVATAMTSGTVEEPRS